MKLYKVLDNNKSCTAGEFDWTGYLPHNGQPGDWTPPIIYPIMCERGYHGTDTKHLIYFIHGNQLFEVEAKDIIWSEDGKKFTSKSMRLIRQVPEWNDHTLRLFAVWCAREMLKELYDPYPEGEHACNVAEKFANGEASAQEISDVLVSTGTPYGKDIAWNASRATLKLPAWRAARDTIWSIFVPPHDRTFRIKFLEMLGLRQVIP